MLFLYSLSQEEKSLNGLVRGQADEQLQSTVNSAAELLRSNVSEYLLLLLLSAEKGIGQPADEFAEQESEFGWATKGGRLILKDSSQCPLNGTFFSGETKTGPRPDRAQFNDESSITCTANLLGLLLFGHERHSSGTRHHFRGTVLRLFRQTKVLTI